MDMFNKDGRSVVVETMSHAMAESHARFEQGMTTGFKNGLSVVAVALAAGLAGFIVSDVSQMRTNSAVNTPVVSPQNVPVEPSSAGKNQVAQNAPVQTK